MSSFFGRRAEPRKRQGEAPKNRVPQPDGGSLRNKKPHPRRVRFCVFLFDRCSGEALNHFNFVGQDRHLGKLHGGMLGDLLGVKSRGTPLQDQAIGQDEDAQIAYAIAQPTEQHVFQAFLFGENAWFE
jgi:hypothetical protein